MKKKKRVYLIMLISVLLIAAILIGLGVAGVFNSAPRQTEPSCTLSLCLTLGDNLQQIDEVRDSDGNPCLFLPACATQENLSSIFDGDYITVDGVSYEPFAPLRGVALEGTHEIGFYRDGALAEARSIQFYKSENVPSMYINTETGAYFSEEDKTVKLDCSSLLAEADGTVNYQSNKDRIRGHGNYSWLGFAKRSYNLYLDKKTSLLSMEKGKHWVLLSNGHDLSLLKNKLVYDFAREFGMAYSPECQWVDLYVDGNYRGLYLLTEKTEVAKNRVELSDNGCLFTGEFHDRMTGGGNEFLTGMGKGIVVKYPENQPAVYKALEKRLNAFEAVLSRDCTLEELSSYIDVESFIKKYLVEEVSMECDSGSSSDYYYFLGSVENSILYAGPLWDYDLSFEMPLSHKLCPNPQAKKINRIYSCLYANRASSANSISWYNMLYQNEAFRNRAIEIYKQELLPLISQYETVLANYADFIRTAALMNEKRFGYGSFEDAVVSTENFLTIRIAALNRLWLSGDSFYTVELHGYGIQYDTYRYNLNDYVAKGTEYILPDPDNENFGGWYYDAEFTKPCEGSFTPTGDIVLYAKWVTPFTEKVKTFLKKIGKTRLLIIGLSVLGILALGCVILIWKRKKKIS